MISDLLSLYGDNRAKATFCFSMGATEQKITRDPRSGAAPEDLGEEDDVEALPAELADGLAHDLLGAARGVDHGVVEEVDAMVAEGLEEGLGLLDVELVAEADPGAVGELAHFEAGPA
ncbi:hypothetical protein ACFX16_030664 [Malus domestica]